MGGIAGIICSERVSGDNILNLIEKMLRSIYHRGIFDSAKAGFPYGAMGHQRHAMIDPRGGAQPFYHLEKPYILAFDGEIYNYRALRAKLESRGVPLHTRSDVEVLMMLYDLYDEEMFAMLEGDYALAIWNGIRKELILARDPIGVRPMYYEMDDYGIAFASELKAIHQARRDKPRLNEVALQHYLALGYIPSPMTMFDGIFKLPPGYMLRWRIEDQSLEVLPTWIPDDEVSQHILQNRNLPLDAALAQFDQRFRHAVSQQLSASDMPLGVLLTGSLASTTVAAAMAREAEDHVHSFTVGYRYAKGDKDYRNQARQVAKALNMKHYDLVIGPEDLDQLPRLLWFMDEPIADPMMLVMEALSRKACESVKGVLTGIGANPLFGGDAKFARFRQFQQAAMLPFPARLMAAPVLSPAISQLLGWEAGQLTHAMLTQNDYTAMWHTYRNFGQAQRQKLLKAGAGFPDKRLKVYSKGAYDAYVSLQWDDFHHELPHGTLHMLDRMMMANSIEARSPFLHHHLMTWCLGLPEGYKRRGNRKNVLLHQYAKQTLPQNLFRLVGPEIQVPLDTWLFTRFDDIKPTLLNSELLNNADLFNVPYVKKLVSAYESGRLKSAQPIWNLFVLNVWYNVHTQCTGKEDIWEMQISRMR